MSQSNLKVTTMHVNNAELFPNIIALLEENHTITLGLRGFSMRPFLEDGRDIALLKKAENYNIGEPVLAEIRPGIYVLHRLIGIDDDKVTLLGDGNLTPEHCCLSDIKAQVIGFYRKGRNTLDRIDGKKWKTYSYIWMKLRPTRRYILAIYRRWVRIFGPI